MSWTRRFLYCFWALVITLLSWNLYQCHQSTVERDHLHAVPAHVFFYHSDNVHAKGAAPAHHDGPDVQQTSFAVEDNTPSTVAFTCHVTLTNKGTAKAVNVQVQVRPYLGVTLGDEDVGRSQRPANASNPLAQFGQWISFPDLAPGQSSTQNAVFMKQGNAHPGRNPTPQIIFEAARK